MKLNLICQLELTQPSDLCFTRILSRVLGGHCLSFALSTNSQASWKQPDIHIWALCFLVKYDVKLAIIITIHFISGNFYSWTFIQSRVLLSFIQKFLLCIRDDFKLLQIYWHRNKHYIMGSLNYAGSRVTRDNVTWALIFFSILEAPTVVTLLGIWPGYIMEAWKPRKCEEYRVPNTL